MPDLLRRVAAPLAAGAWTNANALGVLVAWPDWQSASPFRAAIGASFVITTAAFVGLATVAIPRSFPPPGSRR